MHGDNGLRVVYVTVLVVLVGAVIVAAYIWGKDLQSANKADDREDKVRFYSATVNVIGILLWPLIWTMVIGFDRAKKQPATLFGLVWPIVVTLVQLQSDQIDTSPDYRPIVPSSYKDTSIIITVTFSLATLLISSFPDSTGNRRKVTQLLMFAIILAVSFMLPLGNLTGEDHEGNTGTILQATQRVLLNYAMGFVISAITIFLSPEKDSVISTTA